MSGSSSNIRRSNLTVAAVGVFAAVAVFALFVLLPAAPAQALYARLSLTIDAEGGTSTEVSLGTSGEAEGDTHAQVLKIVAGQDTVNLGEKAVPLGEMKEKPESAEQESESDQPSSHKRGLDLKIEKRRPHDINITIGEDRNYGDGKDIVRFGEDIAIAETDTIDGDVVSIGGSVTVSGVVMGDCVSIGGCISIGPRGVIEGDGVSVGGCINREPGSVLKGDEVVTGGNIPKWIFRGGWPQYGLSGFKFLGFAFAVGKALVVLFLAWLVVLMSRSRVTVTSDRVKSSLLASFGVGLLTIILTPIAMVLLCITLIGIPVAILLPLALLVAVLFGYTAVGLAIGTRLFGSESRATSVVKATLLGVLLMEVIPIVGRLIGLPGGFMWGLSIPIRIIGYAIVVCAVLIGLGATILSKLGQAPRATISGGTVPAPGAPAGTPGPVPQSSGVPGYGAPTGGTPVTPA